MGHAAGCPVPHLLGGDHRVLGGVPRDAARAGGVSTIGRDRSGVRRLGSGHRGFAAFEPRGRAREPAPRLTLTGLRLPRRSLGLVQPRDGLAQCHGRGDQRRARASLGAQGPAEVNAEALRGGALLRAPMAGV